MGFNLFNRRTILIIIILGYSITGFSQKKITDWKIELEHATTARARADASFEIATAYAGRLKIDSALYFANKIKEYSEQGKYETGIGKYHLAFAIAVFYRGRNDESEKKCFKSN